MSTLFLQNEITDLCSRRFELKHEGLGPNDARNAILFGAGGGGRFFLRFMREAGVEPLFFVDNAKKLWGTEVEGVPVLPPSELLQNENTKVILCTAFALREQVKQCHELGVIDFVPYFNFIQEPFPFVAATDSEVDSIFSDESISMLYGLWSDENSKHVYKGTLAFRVTQDVRDMPPYQCGEYFISDFFSTENYIRFVDGGAFNGDTLKELLNITEGKIEYYHGFEPDYENYRELEKACSSLSSELQDRISIYEVALGENIGEVSFQSWGNACSSIGDDGSVRVNVNSLDNVLSRENCPTFIKLDIEGAEPEALIGMEKTLRRCRPALAICVYHEVEHLWKIPLWINRLGLGYRLYLRKHSESYSETVCYAVPDS